MGSDLLGQGPMCVGELFAPDFERPFASGINQPADLFGQRWQTRLCITGDGEVHGVEAAEILVVRLEVQIVTAERDDARAWLEQSSG